MFHHNVNSKWLALIVAAVFVLDSAFALIPASTAAMSVQGTAQNVDPDLPVRLASRSAAEKAGCRFVHLKGPSIDSCILTDFHNNQMDLAIYEPSRDGVYTKSTVMELSSWYWGAKVSFIDAAEKNINWMAISTEGMRGTGISQRILLVIGWDGSRYRTLASETLDYGCYFPTSPEDFKLQVRYAFEPISGRPGLRIQYELMKGENRIGAWSDQLRFNPSTFTFVPFRNSVELSNLAADRVREEIRRTRVYATAQQLNPADSLPRQWEWLDKSGLLESMTPACFGMNIVTGPREFAGKWGLDRKRMAKLDVQGASPVPEALVIGWDKTALTIGEYGAGFTGKPYSVSLTDRETTVPVGATLGTAKAEWREDQLVVTITTSDRKSPVVRRYYRVGPDLIVESTDGDRSTRATYQKS